MPNSTTRSLRSKIFWRLYKVPFWKKALVCTLVIVVILTTVFGILTWRDMSKVLIFNKEMTALSEASEKDDDTEFQEILNRTKSKDSVYAAMEQGVKAYTRETTEEINDLTWMLGPEGIMTAVDSLTLANDDENLSNGHAILAEANKVIAEKRAARDKFFSESGALSYVDESILGDDERKLYLEYTFYSEENEALEEIYDDVLDAIEQAAAIYDDALNYLSENRAHWSIEGESISFDDESYYNEFTDRTAKVGELLEEYAEKHKDALDESEEITD